jgi:hypothetical protein
MSWRLSIANSIFGFPRTDLWRGSVVSAAHPGSDRRLLKAGVGINAGTHTRRIGIRTSAQLRRRAQPPDRTKHTRSVRLACGRRGVAWPCGTNV